MSENLICSVCTVIKKYFLNHYIVTEDNMLENLHVRLDHMLDLLKVPNMLSS